MRHPWLMLLFPLTILTACGRNDDLEHRVRNYDVIEEGQAAGVTTSLSGQTVPSLTATNVDTTTDLTLLPGTTETPVIETAGPGSLAETLEVGQPAPPLRGAPAGTDRPSPPPSTRAAQAPDTRQRSEPVPAAPPRRAAPARPAEPEQTAPEPTREAPDENAPERKAPEPEAPPPSPPSEEPPPERPPTTTSTQPEAPPPPPTTTAPEGSRLEVL